jgi:hypothetical protein
VRFLQGVPDGRITIFENTWIVPLTPGFIRVSAGDEIENGFNRFVVVMYRPRFGQTVETVVARCRFTPG